MSAADPWGIRKSPGRQPGAASGENTHWRNEMNQEGGKPMKTIRFQLEPVLLMYYGHGSRKRDLSGF